MACGPLVHAFSTRVGPDGDPFDLGPGGAASAEVARRRRHLLRAAGFVSEDVLAPVQVHGDRLADADADPGVEADGVLLDPARHRRAAGVRTADCVPLLLQTRDGRAAAAVHAGWRGTGRNIARRVVEALAARGIGPGELQAAIGPSIRSCCYEVGDEVVEAVSAACGHDGAVVRGASARGGPAVRVDLASANRFQLLEAGLDPSAIHVCPACTACRTDLLFSWRAEGPRAGRMMAVIGRGCP